MQAEDISLMRKDELFKYRLKVDFFNGSGSLEILPEKIEIRFRDAHNLEDVQTIKNCVAIIGSIVELPIPVLPNAVQIDFHARLVGTTRDDYFSKVLSFRGDQRFQGSVMYHTSKTLESDVRILVERSNGLPDGLFINWSSNLAGMLNADSIKSIEGQIREDLREFELQIPVKQ